MEAQLGKITEWLAKRKFELAIRLIENLENTTPLNTTTVHQILQLLKRFISLESHYHTFSYVRPKMFKKENTEVLYGALAKLIRHELLGDKPLELSKVLAELDSAVQLRQQLIPIYIQFSHTAFDDIGSEACTRLFAQKIKLYDSPLIQSIRNEVDMLFYLFNAEHSLKSHDLQGTCYSFYSATNAFHSCFKETEDTDLKKFLYMICDTFSVKMKLQFQKLSSEPTERNFIIERMKDSTQAGDMSLHLVYPVKQDHPFFHQSGYTCIENNERTGLQNYPSIHSIPNKDVTNEHWPNIISILQTSEYEEFHHKFLESRIISQNKMTTDSVSKQWSSLFSLFSNSSKEVVDRKPSFYSFFDNKLETTYFMAPVSRNVVLVGIITHPKSSSSSDFDFSYTYKQGFETIQTSISDIYQYSNVLKFLKYGSQ